MGRRILKIAAWLAAVAASLLLIGILWLRSSLPETDGEMTLAGLAATVEVIRDGNGVPHIFAENDRDAYFALGFAHAQDRLWQMEFMRRLGAGRLSEILGERTIRTDRYIRTLGVYRLAEKMAETLPPEMSAVLDAYAAGVNAYIESRSGALPPEFLLLRHRPERWQPADSLVWGKLMGLQLSTGWRGDLLRARLSQVVGADRLRELFPAEADDAPTTIAGADLPPERLDALAAAVPGFLSSDSASNAWVLAGNRTRSGKPILANDPHLGFSAPGLWYLARITTPERTMSGATTPGVPLHLLGQNGRIAWGMTTTGADTSDLFVETTAPGDPDRYLTPAGPVPFETRRETVRVRDNGPVEFTVRSTRHGPVISDVSSALLRLAGERQVVALADTVLSADDSTVEALYRINRARDADAFMAAARLFTAPHQNLFVADAQGSIGYVGAGRMPIRRAGTGHSIVFGAKGEFDWTDAVLPRKWPRLRDPESGLIANANNRVRRPGLAYPLAWYWPESHRAARILERLDGAVGLTVEDSTSLQFDRLSVAARRLVPQLAAVEPRSETARKALALVRLWGNEMRRDRPEPLIYAAWTRHLMASLVADELGERFASFYDRPRPRVLLNVLTRDRHWCDDVRTPRPETCADRIALALERAVAELAARHGDDPASWRWGDEHEAVFAHRILSQVPLAGAFADRAIETDGGDHTLNRGQTGGSVAAPYRHTHGAGYRAVYDLAEPANSRYVIATGQSGNPLSGHYMDMLRRWRDGGYIRIAGDRDSLRRAGADNLTLRPAGSTE